MLVKKVTAAQAAGDTLDFVLSDATVDRYGDVIDPKGWLLQHFQANPIALFNHDSDFPIGTWQDVRVAGGQLVGRLALAAASTSPRIAELVSLVAQGVLRAVSVGFQPLASEPRDKSGSGMLFTRQELLECSLVSVPANPSALQIAKRLHLSDDTIRMAFGEQADQGHAVVRRSAAGEPAATSRVSNGSPMNLSKRIEGAQQLIAGTRAQLIDHLAGVDDANPDEASLAMTDELNGRLEQQQRSLDSLRQAEARLAAGSEAATGTPAAGAGAGATRRPFAVAAKKVNPVDYVYRSAVVTFLAKVQQRTIDDVMRERYGDDEPTRAVFAAVTRSATAPAMTNQPTWAQELVQTAVLDFIDALLPMSIYPGLSAKGGRFTFGQNGTVVIPARSTTPTIAGSFVGQGAPIPVRQGGFAATSLTPRKMGVISTFTREMAAHSTPSIEGILRQAIQEDTAVAIDTVLTDANAATSIRPAGLRNGVTGLTPTAGGGFTALVADLKALVGALIASTNGHIRAPVWIMNPIQALSVSMTTNTAGDFPFKADITSGTLLTFPVLQSASVPVGQVMLVDAADFFSATGDDPRFDVSDQAVLHMEDTTPLAISATGTPNTVAAPVRSLFQTDSIAIRMLLDINWALRRPGVVAFVAAVTW